jgi:DnaJ-class molecular chaperone
MSEKEHDYYEVLGLDPAATSQEIDAAYRSLAMKYHPDTSRGVSPGADEFKQITEAHEVLADPNTRRRYDKTILNTKLRSSFRQSPAFQLDLPIAPEEARYGGVVPVKLKTRFPCRRCADRRQRSTTLCPTCNGQGFVLKNLSFTVNVPAGIQDGARFFYADVNDPDLARPIQFFIRIRPSW